MTPQIVPGIIAKDQIDLSDKIEKVKDYAQRMQLDIMDGIFVDNKSLDFDFYLPPVNRLFEAHLMVSDPDDWLKNNWQKADVILIPFESCKNIGQAIDFLKNKKKVGLSLNPKTPLSVIRGYLNDIDQVLIMTVNPGFYGKEFLSEPLKKVKELRKLKPDLDIEVDGGINPGTIKLAREAGANLFVSGSYIFKSADPAEAIKNLQELWRQ